MRIILFFITLLTIKIPLAAPVIIDLPINNIWFPSIILGINEQCRLNQNAVRSRALCDDTRVVDPFTQIADGFLEYEFGKRIYFTCNSGWQNMEGGAWQYQLRFRINGRNKRCGTGYTNTSGTTGETATSRIRVFAWLRVNDWNTTTAKLHTIPFTFNIDY